MNAHLRANLWLLTVTVLLCCVLYPLVLWVIGQAVFADKAAGSLVDKDGKPTREVEKAVGSRLIAQPFNGPEYFQPRPSSPSYDASASGGSNFGANNPKLRARVARTLGPIVRYKDSGELVGPDIEAWFTKDHFQGAPHLVAQWAQKYPFLALDWIKADKLNSDFVARWQTNHPKEVAEWVAKNPAASEPKPEDLAVPFFIHFSETHPGTWPGTVETKVGDKTEKRIGPVTEDDEIRRDFFDLWLQEAPRRELLEVPADMVMSSGSGLDPHITLKNAMYQLDHRVAKEWADKTGVDRAKVREAVAGLLKRKAEAPLGGLAGVELLNVLEVNLALPEAMKRLSKNVAGGGGPR